MNYQAVLFDMDGVIVDSEPLHVAAFQTTLKNYGHNLSHEQYLQHFAGKTDEAGFKQYFDFIGETVDRKVVMDEKARAYLEIASDQLAPYPGVVEFIQDLAGRGVPLALVTGSLRTEADIALSALNIGQYFSTIVAAEDVEHGKPNPEGYLKAAKTLGVPPTDCVVIEDSPSGVAAANAAGIRCVAVSNTHHPQELKSADRILTQLKPGCLSN